MFQETRSLLFPAHQQLFRCVLLVHIRFLPLGNVVDFRQLRLPPQTHLPFSAFFFQNLGSPLFFFLHSGKQTKKKKQRKRKRKRSLARWQHRSRVTLFSFSVPRLSLSAKLVHGLVTSGLELLLFFTSLKTASSVFSFSKTLQNESLAPLPPHHPVLRCLYITVFHPINATTSLLHHDSRTWLCASAASPERCPRSSSATTSPLHIYC